MAGYIVSFAVVAAFSTTLWLLVFGVNERRWREQEAHTIQQGELQ